jgi:predicted nucleic acid-binding protein
VLSEIRKSNCNPKVKAYTDKIPLEDLFICTFSLGEIIFGIEKLPEGKKRNELSLWLFEQLPQCFENRILPLGTEEMLEWGRLCAAVKRTPPIKDSFIAATALAHHLTLLTRNIRDFENILGLRVSNPWD